jgi:signal peptidase I
MLIAILHRLIITNVNILSPVEFPPLPRPTLQRRPLLREIVELLTLTCAVYALVNLATVRYLVDGTSMQPNFESGQFLMVSRLHYVFGSPERGDIIVFHYPGDPLEDYLKRIIGLPGDTVEIREGWVYVNGVMLDESYTLEPCQSYLCPDHVWTLDENEYFVMGDNRNNSTDSRAFGPVRREYIIGEVLLRYWPPYDWGIVSRIAYVEP